MKIFILALFAIISIVKCYAQSEISLYDKGGNAVAYLSPNDEWCIYSWQGKPLAYVSNDGQIFHVYGFNGKHLGWYLDGILIDHDGNAVGFRKGAISNVYEQYENYKGNKEYRPFRSYQEYAPSRPYYTAYFSAVTLLEFLYQGINNATLQRKFKVYDSPDPIMETDLDLVAKVNIKKQMMFDQRTSNVQATINQISYYLNQIKQYDHSEFNRQYSILKTSVTNIGKSRIDYSDINQYNQIITPLNNHLSIVVSKLKILQNK